MKLVDIYNVVRFIVKDNKSTPDFIIDEFNDIIKAVNTDILNKKLSPYFPNYRQGILTDIELSKFVIKDSFTVSNSKINFPEGYYIGIGGINTLNNKPIKIVTPYEYYEMMSNKAERQIRFHNIAIEDNLSQVIKFLPLNTTNVEMVYFRKPAEPRLYYKYDSDLGYNKITGETNFEWGERLHAAIIREILNYMGIQTTLDMVNSTIQNVREK